MFKNITIDNIFTSVAWSGSKYSCGWISWEIVSLFQREIDICDVKWEVPGPGRENQLFGSSYHGCDTTPTKTIQRRRSFLGVTVPGYGLAWQEGHGCKRLTGVTLYPQAGSSEWFSYPFHFLLFTQPKTTPCGTGRPHWGCLYTSIN